MNNHFVSPELSLRLKKLGYDEPCFGFYEMGSLMVTKIPSGKVFENSDSYCLAPTRAQAFNWIRDNFGLHSFIDIYPTTENPNRCWFMVRYMERGTEKEDYMSGWYDDHSKAEVGCLNKLIELVESQS